MIRIGILGDIGSGKSYVAKNFGYPVFDADAEVHKLYKRNRLIFKKLKKTLPKYFYSFPVDKRQVSQAILDNKENLKKIVKIIHEEIRKRLNFFLFKNRKKKIVILDIPLLLENKINKNEDILIFVQSNRSNVIKRLKKRKNFNKKLFDKFKKIQFSSKFKKNKAHFIIKNNFKKNSVKKDINRILREIL